jgi:hypothetical protein
MLIVLTEENHTKALSLQPLRATRRPRGEKMRTLDKVVTRCRAGVAACHGVSGTSHKSRLRRASLSRGDAVFRGVLRVPRAHVPSFLPK